MTQIIKCIQGDTSSNAIEDYGNDRIQLKIDLIERVTYEQILEIIAQYEAKQ